MSMNGLEKITEKILAEANAESERILADAEAERERILASYREQADAIRTRVAEEAEREGAALIAQAKNGATVQKRNAILRVRGELVDETFSLTLQGLKVRDDRYVETLAGLLCAAFLEQMEAEEVSRTLYGEEEAMAPEQYEVLFHANDRERYAEAVLSAARTRLSGRVGAEKLSRLTVSEQAANLDSGLILRCGEVETNCSLELLFADLRRELEGEVSHALFDVKERS